MRSKRTSRKRSHRPRWRKLRTRLALGQSIGRPKRPILELLSLSRLQGDYSSKVCGKHMPTSSIRALSGLRIAVGALFVIFGEYKVVGTQFTLGGGFQYWISRFLQDGAYPLMVPVLKNFV